MTSAITSASRTALPPESDSRPLQKLEGLLIARENGAPGRAYLAVFDAIVFNLS